MLEMLYFTIKIFTVFLCSTCPYPHSRQPPLPYTHCRQPPSLTPIVGDPPPLHPLSATPLPYPHSRQPPSLTLIVGNPHPLPPLSATPLPYPHSRYWNVNNRPFPSSLLPLFQNETKCETFHMKMSFTHKSIRMQIILIFI